MASPHNPKLAAKYLVPAQDMPTIGDELTDAGVSWAWYSGEWNEALAGRVSPDTFEYHHQPFVFFRRYGDGTIDRAEHLKDEDTLLTAIARGVLPAVSFVKPGGLENAHPGYSDIVAGDEHALRLVSAIKKKSKLWKHTLIIVTYDENGGFWDHVAPPKGDPWGPGARVPTIVISPFAQKHHVDHTIYSTTSILAFIEKRWHLKPLGTYEAKADPLTGVFPPAAGR